MFRGSFFSGHTVYDMEMCFKKQIEEIKTKNKIEMTRDLKTGQQFKYCAGM